MSTTSGNSRVRSIAGNVLTFLPGFALGMSSLLKCARVPGVVHEMALAGFADGKLLLIAALEIVSAVLFLFPKTRSLGLLFVSAFLGGAICTHVQMGEFVKAFPPSILLTFAWVGT